MRWRRHRRGQIPRGVAPHRVQRVVDTDRFVALVGEVALPGAAEEVDSALKEWGFAHCRCSRELKDLQTFPNPNPERDYEIAFEAPEFTCLCPMTAQPDFARSASATCRTRMCRAQVAEATSGRIAMRNLPRSGLRTRIANDLIAAARSALLYVEGDFYVRGGIKTVVEGGTPEDVD